MFGYLNRQATSLNKQPETTNISYNDMFKSLYDRLVNLVYENTKSKYNHLETGINLSKDITKLLPYNIGDNVILNIYDLKYNSRNGWDCGAHGISYMDKNKIIKPAIVKIKNISVSYTLANENIDKWLNKTTTENLYYLFYKSDDILFLKYQESLYKQTYKDSCFDEFGIYINVYWESTKEEYPDMYNESILDSRCYASFLKLDSEEGQTTYDVWLEEIKLRLQLDEINIKREKIQTKLNDLKNILKLNNNI